jgi:hypothetical protein
MTGHALTNIMGSMGRYGDDMVGHLSHGDVVIPRAIVLEHPEFLTKFKKAMEDNDADYRSHVAGSGYENKNPHTGASEFFFSGFKSFFNKIADNPMAGVMDIMQDSASKRAPSAPAPAPMAPSTPAPNLGPISQEFTPKRPDAAVQPFGLFNSSVGGQQFSTLDPMQQRSYLATQGSQGGGLGDEAKNYYTNLLQRNLIDENGQQQNINSALLPVERNYLSTLGLPTDNTTDFFKALQK